MAQFVTNADAVLKSSRATKKQMSAAMSIANRAAADAAVRYQRRMIPPPMGAGLFPGYAARGLLRGSIQARGPFPVNDGVRSWVYMEDNGSQIYRRIHERGGIILPRRKKYLTFKIHGRWVRAKQVRIRPKHYWRDGWKLAKSLIQMDFEQALKKALPR